MVGIEADGSLAFRLYRPGASCVELVRSIEGRIVRIRMHRRRGGHWVLRVAPGPGECLYRFLVDGSRWLLDAGADGCCLAVDGTAWGRVDWGPPGRAVA